MDSHVSSNWLWLICSARGCAPIEMTATIGGHLIMKGVFSILSKLVSKIESGFDFILGLVRLRPRKMHNRGWVGSPPPALCFFANAKKGALNGAPLPTWF
jgi:hypothetical protein